MIYETTKTENSGVFGYYDGVEMKFLEGDYKELRKLQANREKEFQKQSEKKTLRIVLVLFFGMLAMAVLGYVMLPLRMAIALFVFCLMSYFPILVLLFANMDMYDDGSMQHQFRRYHASEHMVVSFYEKKKPCTLENVKRESIYEQECGTVWCGTLLVLAVIVSLVILNGAAIGVFRSILLVLGACVFLFVNMLNPWNPLKLCQYAAVEKPTEKEILLAMETMNRLMECDQEK